MSRVWVVGSVNEDTRLTLAAHVRPGETVTATSSARQLGGKGLNQAIAARRAGADTVMVAAVGADDAARSARDLLAAEGIETRLFVSDRPTGTAIVAVDDAGENAIIVVPGANAAIPEEHVRVNLTGVAPGDIVLLQLELPVDIVRAATAAARRAGATVVLNAAPYRPEVTALLAEVDLLVVNASELAALVPGPDDPAGAARRLSTERTLAVLVTLGGDGSVLAGHGTSVHVPACATTVVDTTGAGDTYIGFLTAALAAGRSPRAAMDAAGAAAALAVSRPGAATSIPNASEIGIPVAT